MKEIVITSSVLILALLVLRLVFAKKVSRRLIYAAWLLVALRLLIPVQVGQLDFSVLTAAQPLTDTISEFTDLRVAGQTETDAQRQVIAQYIEDDLSVFEDAVQNRIEEAQRNYYTTEEIAQMVDKIYSVDTAFKPDAQDQVSREIEARTNPVSLGNVLTVIWLVGVAAMGGWFLFVNLRYGKNLRRDAQRLDCDSPIPVYVSEFADSPCLAGLLRPTIYMNPYCAESEEMRRHVLTHELTHYRHKDHLWNLVRCLCLCVYWFHPLVWVAVYVCRRDCELACDEGAMEKLGDDERISYGKTLLEVVRHRLYPSDWLQTATSMTETKRELKNRVNFIAKKSRISFIAALAMVLVCAIVTGCVAAGPGGEKEEPKQTVYLPTSYKLTSEEETIDRQFIYNEVGQCVGCTEIWDSEGFGHVETERTYEYDSHGNLIRETWHQIRTRNEQTHESEGEEIYYHTYDDKGRVVDYSDADGAFSFHFEYDDAENKIIVTNDEEEDWFSCYTYDEQGRMIQNVKRHTIQGDQDGWEYAYDLIEYTYTEDGKILSYHDKNGYSMEKLAVSQMEQVEKWVETPAVEFHYDDRGNLTGTGNSEQYQYDQNNHLILPEEKYLVSIRGEMVEKIAKKYTLDDNGNIIRFESTKYIEEVTYVAMELTASQIRSALLLSNMNYLSAKIFDFSDMIMIPWSVKKNPWSWNWFSHLLPGAPW